MRSIAELDGHEVQLEFLGSPDPALLRPLFSRSSFVRGAAGRVVLAEGDRFEFRSISVTDQKSFHVQANWPAGPVTPGRIKTATDELLRDMPHVSVQIIEALTSRAPDSIPVLAAVEVDPLGNIWLLPRSPDTGDTNEWLVFSTEGHPLARVSAAELPPIAYVAQRSLVAIELREDGVSVPCVYEIRKSDEQDAPAAQ